MQREAAQELNATRGNRFLHGPVPLIFGNDGYLSIRYIQDPLVGYGYPVGILAQVFNHVVCLGQRRFTMYHPLGMVSFLSLFIE